MMNPKHAPFIKAIFYADIFDFPLTRDEIWRFAIGRSTKEDLEQFFTSLPSYIKRSDGYFYPEKRKPIIVKRQERQKASEKKLRIAKKACDLLVKIPTIQCIGISGGLSLFNADTKDDIDFFIITKKNTVWTTRLFVALLLELSGMRRKRGGLLVSDSICVNMYLDEGHMRLSKQKRDLYSAHEVMQVLPIFSRHNTYEKFIRSNKWAVDFLPNAFQHGIIRNHTPLRSAMQNFEGQARNPSEPWFNAVLCSALSSSMLEKSVRLFQQLYMRRHRTREVISDTILAFHPIDYRGNTMSEFAKRVHLYEKI